MAQTEKAARRAQSARALLWTAAIAALLGVVTPSPAGTLLLLAVAVLFATIAAALGRNRLRLIAGLVAAALLALTLASYPAYRAHMDAYLERAATKSR